MKQLKQTAKNYAQALLELFEANIQLQEEVLNEIKLINESLSKIHDARLIFENPIIPKEEKKALIKKLFQGKVNQRCLNLLFLLIDKQRFYLLGEIQNEFIKLVNKNKGIIIAKISSVSELDTNTVESIKESLEKTLKNSYKISVETKIDPELLGGIVVKINDLVYDGSIKGRLGNLKRNLGC